MNTESVIHPPADRPVFVDESGRRARLLRVAGAFVVGLLALWMIAVAAGLMGLGRLPGVPLLGDSGKQEHRPADKLSKQAAPTPSTAGRPGSSGTPRAPSANRTPSSRAQGNGTPPAGTPGNSGQAPAVGRPADPGSQSQAAPRGPAKTTNPGATAPGRSNPNSRNPKL
jgi:hypothetical protein